MRLPLDAVMFIKPLGQTVLQKKKCGNNVLFSLILNVAICFGNV